MDSKVFWEPQKDFYGPQRVLQTPKVSVAPLDSPKVPAAPQLEGQRGFYGPEVFMALGFMAPGFLWPLVFPTQGFMARCVKVPPAIKIWELLRARRLPGAARAGVG